MSIYKSISNTIGNTPLLNISNFFDSSSHFFIKLEGQNPSGSIKDRVALCLIDKAIKNGNLKQGQTILEATSGNMGIALAFVGAIKKIPVEIVMSESMSIERRTIIKNYGAKLTLTDKSLGTTGALQKAKELQKENPEKYFFVDQFNNPDNPESYKNLAKEIIEAVPNMTHFVVGIGTSGTLMGVAKYLKKIGHPAKIIAIIPPKGFKVQGIQNPYEDFLPKIFDENLIDEKIHITFEEAKENTNLIGQKMGLFLGGSSGGAIAGAKKLQLKQNDKVVIISADRGEKYLSTELFNK